MTPEEAIAAIKSRDVHVRSQLGKHVLYVDGIAYAAAPTLSGLDQSVALALKLTHAEAITLRSFLLARLNGES